MIYRNGNDNSEPIRRRKILRVTGTGVLAPNLLQYWGAVRIVSQWAQIIAITTLVNLTDVYASADSAGGSVDLTKTPGSVLSGFEVGSFFLKDLAESAIYTTLNADQARSAEAPTSKAGQPFILNQENGVDSFITFHATTTDAPVDFMMDVFFKFERLTAGSNLVFL